MPGEWPRYWSEDGNWVITIAGESGSGKSETAEALALGGERAAASETMRLVETPDARTIQDLVTKHGMPIEKTVKTLIVAAAGRSGAGILLTEDLQDGLLVEDRLRVRNPFG